MRKSVLAVAAAGLAAVLDAVANGALWTARPTGKFNAVSFDLRAHRHVDGTRSSCVTVAGRRSQLPDGSTAVRGVAATCDSRYVFVVHGLARYHLPVTQLDHGWVNSSAMSVFDGETGRLINTVPLDDSARGAANPWGVAVNDRWIAVSHAGTHEVSIIDRAAFFAKLLAYAGDATSDLGFMRGIRRRVALKGRGPRAIRFRSDGCLEVELHYAEAVAIVDPETGRVEEPDLPNGVSAAVAVNPVRMGEMYFNDATLCYQGWQSCGSCHVDGRDDGLTWDFPGSGGGIGHTEETVDLARLQELKPGRVANSFPVSHLFAVPPDVADAVDAYIRSLSVGVLDEVRRADESCDAAVASIRTVDELKAKQSAWRMAWLDGIGGLPERTPLNAKEGPAVQCDGFTLQNVLFESQPGVYVVGHLALPSDGAAKPPYPAVLMPLGHSDTGILNPRYAAHMAMTARAGFAAFAWDPIAQGERQQASDGRRTIHDCAEEHSSIGARGWLVGWNFARFRIWDGMRAIDWLETRKDVDCSRLGVMGTSGGGTMSAYMQALDDRIKVAFPNCFVSSIREVFAERGCHDAEQFFWNQLGVGVNHAAMLMMGQPRVALATGSRYKDYFPHGGAESTFAVFASTANRLGCPGPFWHFHCDGPHGIPPPTRAAQVDWMCHCILGADVPKQISDYQALDDFGRRDDPVNAAPLPFPQEAAFFTSTHNVRDLTGFKSIYSIIADRAAELARTRKPKTREELRAIVRRRAAIRPLADLPSMEQKPFDHPKFGWWYLDGAYGNRRENEAAMLATLGRSVVGRDAENVIVRAAAQMKANGGNPIPLVAKGWDCIAAAHAYAAEPQLFSEVRFSEPPPSWTAMVKDPAPGRESYAVAVWGALEEYDWTDLVERTGRASAPLSR